MNKNMLLLSLLLVSTAMQSVAPEASGDGKEPATSNVTNDGTERDQNACPCGGLFCGNGPSLSIAEQLDQLMRANLVARDQDAEDNLEMLGGLVLMRLKNEEEASPKNTSSEDLEKTKK